MCLAAHLDDAGRMPLTDFCNQHYDTRTRRSLNSQARGSRRDDHLHAAPSGSLFKGPEHLRERGAGPPFGNPTPG